MKKYYFSILFLVMFYQIANSLENTSYRIQTLGSDFQGIIDDEYTDILANPARLNAVDKKQVYVKAASPLTVGYMTSKFGCLVEGYESLNQRENRDERSIMYTWAPTVKHSSDNLTTYKTQNETLDFLFFKPINKGKISSGIGFFGSKNNYVYNNSPDNRYNWHNAGEQDIKYIDLSTTKIIGLHSSISKYQTNIENISGKMVGGFYKQDKHKSREFISTLIILQSKTKSRSYEYNYNDEDPDGNGKDKWGYDISTTPYINWDSAEIISKSPASFKLGGEVEYRNRTNTNNGQSGLVFGVAYQPTKTKTDDISTFQTFSVRGTTVTDVVNISSGTTVSEGNKYKLFLGWGKNVGFVQNKLFFAFAGRMDVSYEDIKQESDDIDTTLTERSRQLTTKIAFPMGLEYFFSKILTLRMGFTYYINGSFKDENVLTDSENRYSLQNKSISQSTNYRAGFGINPFDYLLVDFTTSGDVLNANYWKAQVKYSF